MIRDRSKAKLAALLTAFGTLGPLLWGQSDRTEFFETRIRPVLAENCYSCHTQLQTSGLRVDSRASLLRGGNSGPAIRPGNPDESLLIQAVRHAHPRLKM